MNNPTLSVIISIFYNIVPRYSFPSCGSAVMVRTLCENTAHLQ